MRVKNFKLCEISLRNIHNYCYRQFLTQNKRKQKILLPEYRSKNKDGISFLPKSTKHKVKNSRFKTLERSNRRQNAYSGKLKLHYKNKAFRENSNSPAVPMASHSRLSSYSNKMKLTDGSIISDFKMVSQGLNFDVEPFEK